MNELQEKYNKLREIEKHYEDVGNKKALKYVRKKLAEIKAQMYNLQTYGSKDGYSTPNNTRGNDQ